MTITPAPPATTLPAAGRTGGAALPSAIPHGGARFAELMGRQLTG